jgi:hypothetical protein
MTDAESPPPEVLDAEAIRPDCAYSTSLTSSLRVVDGAAVKTTTERWYQRCPGEPRILLHSRTRTHEGEAALAPGPPNPMEDLLRDFVDGQRRGRAWPGADPAWPPAQGAGKGGGAGATTLERERGRGTFV